MATSMSDENGRRLMANQNYICRRWDVDPLHFYMSTPDFRAISPCPFRGKPRVFFVGYLGKYSKGCVFLKFKSTVAFLTMVVFL